MSYREIISQSAARQSEDNGGEKGRKLLRLLNLKLDKGSPLSPSEVFFYSYLLESRPSEVNEKTPDSLVDTQIINKSLSSLTKNRTVPISQVFAIDFNKLDKDTSEGWRHLSEIQSFINPNSEIDLLQSMKNLCQMREEEILRDGTIDNNNIEEHATSLKLTAEIISSSMEYITNE